jgi:hypothetical protein
MKDFYFLLLSHSHPSFVLQDALNLSMTSWMVVGIVVVETSDCNTFGGVYKPEVSGTALGVPLDNGEILT